MTTEGRPVRLTVDGWATTMTDSHGNDTTAVRVRYEGAERAASVLVLTSSPNVTVEDREAPRTWTDGDVVQSPTHVYSRHDETWRGHSVSGLGLAGGPHSDEATNRDVASGFLTVLRYQAGA